MSVEDTNLDAVVLNTNLYYTSNSVEDGTGDPAGQLEWLDGLLTNMNDTGRKVCEMAPMHCKLHFYHHMKHQRLFVYQTLSSKFNDACLAMPCQTIQQIIRKLFTPK